MQLIQFVSHSKPNNSKQLLRNQQLQKDYQKIQQDNQQHFNTLDDVRQVVASLKSDLAKVTAERDSLKMENEELINNQSLALERKDLKEEVVHLESRLSSRLEMSNAHKFLVATEN
jgi:hypothetical protein